jgi:hypothetical protein
METYRKYRKNKEKIRGREKMEQVQKVRKCDRRLRRKQWVLQTYHCIIKINHQPDATIFQFIILTFIYRSICFGRFPAHHQELNDCSSSLWFYLRIVVRVVLCSWFGPVTGPTTGLQTLNLSLYFRNFILEGTVTNWLNLKRVLFLIQLSVSCLYTLISATYCVILAMLENKDSKKTKS